MKQPRPIQNELRIVRLTEHDVKRASDNFQSFEDLVVAHEAMYPRIGDWLKNKVVRGIASSERVAYVGFEGQRAMVSAVVKRGDRSKFCHLHIADDFRNMHVGEVFFAMMALDVRHHADEIYFTLPESLWETRKEFFQSFGFHEASQAHDQYRLFDTELQCSAPFEKVWGCVLQKLPRLVRAFSSDNSALNGLLFSVRPQFASKILRGEKTVEVRRRFDAKWVGRQVSIYSTSPMKAVLGHAVITEVTAGTPKAIWDRYCKSLGCSRAEFDEYTKSADEVYAITLDDITPYDTAMTLSQIQYYLRKDLTPPQSYCSVKNSATWSEALTIAELLNGRFLASHGHIDKSIIEPALSL
jgi:predicted transcriptional regulator